MLQLSPTLCDPMDCSPPGSSVHGILQARILQWVATSLAAQLVKNLPVMLETRVEFLGWQDPLEKGMATHSSILAGKIPWTEKASGLQSMGSQRVGRD